VNEVDDSVRAFFSSFNKRKDRLSFVKKVFSISKLRPVRCNEKGDNIQKLHDVLSFEILFCDVEELIDLMKVVHWRSPLFKCALEMLTSKHISKLDMTNCLYLGYVCTNGPVYSGVKPIFSRLQDLLLASLSNGTELEAAELWQLISVLQNAYSFKPLASAMVSYLAGCLHRFSLSEVSAILSSLMKCNYLNHDRDSDFFTAVSNYCLKVLNMTADVNKRVSCLGKSYGYYLNAFFIFYLTTQFYDAKVCEKLVDVVLGPFDREIHNPPFLSTLMKMCASLQYYNKPLVERIIQVSLNQLDSFHLKELSCMLDALVTLNHEHELFLSRVENVVLGTHDIVRTCSLYWSIMNSSVYMDRYNAEVIQRFITDRMMEGKWLCGWETC